MAAKKNIRRNNNVKNTNNAVSATSAVRPTAKAVSSATAHNIARTIEMVVEDGFNYGSPNIKMINCITVFENNDYVTERHFYINGYKFRMDEIMKCALKCYLLKLIPEYTGVEEIDRVLCKDIKYNIGGNAPQYLQERMKQMTILVRGLIKAFRDSNDLLSDLTVIFGESEYDEVFMADEIYGAMDFKDHLFHNWKPEYKKDYSGAAYRL